MSQLLQPYAKFVRSHVDIARPMEGLLRTLVYFLPSRYMEGGSGEVMTEAALAASNLLTLLHDLIILEAPPADICVEEASNRDLVKKRAGLGLSVLWHTEVLIEKLAERWGGSEDVVLLVETLKAALRLMTLAVEPKEMLLQGGRFSPRLRMEADAANARGNGVLHVNGGGVVESDDGAAAGGSVMQRQDCSRGSRTGRRFHYLVPTDHVRVKLLAEGERCQSDILNVGREGSGPCAGSGGRCSCCPRTPLSSCSAQEEGADEDLVEKTSRHLLLAGEVLHVLRPVMYAYFMWLVRKRSAPRGNKAGGKQGRHALTALLVSGGIDYASHCCTSLAVRGKPPTPAQEDELKRRRMLWLLYLLRSPLFEAGALPAAKALHRGVSRVPLVGSVGTYALHMLLYIQRHWFYTNGS